MKLPEDRKERVKVLSLVAIGVVAVLNGLFAGVLRPHIRKQNDRRTRIAELTEQMEKGRRNISRMVKGQRRNMEVLRDILYVADEKGYILMPRLGNYLLGATEIIESSMQRAGLSGFEVREVGILQLPQPPTETVERALKSYSVHIDMECGIHDLVRLLQIIEEENPYVCISGINVEGQVGKPAAHRVGFDVQWPIWVDFETPDALRALVKKANDFDRDTPTTVPATEEPGEEPLPEEPVEEPQ